MMRSWKMFLPIGGDSRSQSIPRILLPALVGLVFPLLAPAVELAPKQVDTPLGKDGPHIATFSDRTLALALEVDRDAVRLFGYTLKSRPFKNVTETPPTRAYVEGRPLQFEVALLGPGESRYTQRVDFGPLCFSHGPDHLPHVEGDTILVHRDTFRIEVPELPGFDRVEVAYFEERQGATSRRPLGIEPLDRGRFLAAGSAAVYEDLAIANPNTAEGPPVPTASNVRWPEEIPDPDLFTVYGDVNEGDKRINIVIVPDGYRWTDKALMQTHADQMVAHFRAKTPFVQHDPFINYILVYAYSVESGTDECDCDVVKDTAMGTRFPKQNPQCGHGDNRCLYYGGGCDAPGTGNIATAELRAPFHDTTIVMVNTGRYGGCGGGRAVYSAGNAGAREIAVHELGHSLGGLADEYAYNSGCGSNAGEVNTSLNPTDGAWPEWIEEMGAPHEGAQYYQQCVYRPAADCEMRNLNRPFCQVCNQHWSLITFGHPNVGPTAPIESISPQPPGSAWVGIPVDFSVDLRLSSGAGVTNEITWTLSGPGLPEPVVVASDVTEYSHAFAQEGQYSLTVEVVADTNFVKPIRYGTNRDVTTWVVDVETLLPPGEVSSPAAAGPLEFLDRETLVWEDGSEEGVFTYNLYRGTFDDLDAGDYGDCFEEGLPESTTTVPVGPLPGSGWFFLVTGQNPAGEGPLGSDSSGAPRVNASPCGTGS